MPIRVLVVDDEPAIRELLTEYLRGRGMEVTAVVDGESARLRLEREPPDIVLTDLKLPGIDGVEVIRVATACVPPVPSLMMTGFGTVDSAVAAFTAGARDYLAKPFRLRDLYASVERVLAAAERDRCGAWSEAAIALLVRAEAIADPSGAEALVDELLALLAAAPGMAEVRLAGAPEEAALPLGARWVVVTPPCARALPCVRAVHEALLRVGR